MKSGAASAGLHWCDSLLKLDPYQTNLIPVGDHKGTACALGCKGQADMAQLVAQGSQGADQPLL
jgi:hypothetical protein